jgi:hypothetical protein
LPPAPLQPGGKHLGGKGCGLSATNAPILPTFGPASFRLTSALAAIVPAASVVNAIVQRPISLWVIDMLISYRWRQFHIVVEFRPPTVHGKGSTKQDIELTVIAITLISNGKPLIWRFERQFIA